MASLYEIYIDGLKRLRGIQPPDDPSGMSSDLTMDGAGISASLRERESGSPLTQPGGAMFPTSFVPQNQGQIKTPIGNINLPQSVLTKQAAENQKKVLQSQGGGKVPKLNESTYTDSIMQSGTGVKQAEDISFMQKLANMANVDFSKAQATWKEKGGFEGLMANPAFTIGLAFMQAGAEGKTLGQGALDNVIKAGAISQNYKKILDARKEAPIQATAADMAETKDLLSKIGISEGNWFENVGSKIKNFFGKGGSKNPGLAFDAAVEEISVQYQAAVRKKQAQLKAAGKPQILRMDDKLKIMQELIRSNKIQKSESLLSRLGITDATISKDIAGNREYGGPVEANKAYVVGEAGPEVIIPKSDGNVLANDDSQIFAMLLAANPNLQKVSRQRAEKILRNRFPEYFE